MHLLTPIERARNNCICCKKFLHAYGDLAVVDETTGLLKSAIWYDDAEGVYEKPLQALKAAVESSRIKEPYRVTGEELLDGSMSIGYTTAAKQWKHFNLEIPSNYVLDSRAAGSEVGVVKENYNVLLASIRRFSLQTLKNALVLFENDAAFRAENFTEPLRWIVGFIGHLETIKANKGAYANAIWLAASTKPIGFVRVLNNVLGEFLNDLEKGTDTTYALAKHKHKLDPLKYQRPTSPATEMNIARAEKLIKDLELETAMHRRPLRADEAKSFWRPTKVQKVEEPVGIFSKLLPKSKDTNAGHVKEPLSVPNQRMSMAKFIDKIIPVASKVELYLDKNSGYITYLTAVHADAKPIIRWDHPEERNPVSWFFHANSAHAGHFGLKNHQYVNVTGLANLPSSWCDQPEIARPSVTFLLEGFHPQANSSLGLFPEILIPELHSVRSTIEAFINSIDIDFNAFGPCAGGLHYTNVLGDIKVRATTEQGVLNITIDRLD